MATTAGKIGYNVMVNSFLTNQNEQHQHRAPLTAGRRISTNIHQVLGRQPVTYL